MSHLVSCEPKLSTKDTSDFLIESAMAVHCFQAGVRKRQQEADCLIASWDLTCGVDYSDGVSMKSKFIVHPIWECTLTEADLSKDCQSCKWKWRESKLPKLARYARSKVISHLMQLASHGPAWRGFLLACILLKIRIVICDDEQSTDLCQVMFQTSERNVLRDILDWLITCRKLWSPSKQRAKHLPELWFCQQSRKTSRLTQLCFSFSWPQFTNLLFERA